MQVPRRAQPSSAQPVLRLVAIFLCAAGMGLFGLGEKAGAQAQPGSDLQVSKGWTQVHAGRHMPQVFDATAGVDSAPIVTKTPPMASPRRGVLVASELPRSWAGGFPPPRSPVRDPGPIVKGRSQLEAGFSTEVEVSPELGEKRSAATVHPAIHSRPEKTIRIDGPLFDRHGRSTRTSIEFDAEKPSLERSMRMHPAGKGLPGSVGSREKVGSGVDEPSRAPSSPRDARAPGTDPENGRRDESTASISSITDSASPPIGTSRHPHASGSDDSSVGCFGKTHRVRSGETLWSIAADALETADIRRIARYWPKIHRHNRTVIGSNPDQIFPGQILHLPAECDD